MPFHMAILTAPKLAVAQGDMTAAKIRGWVERPRQ